MMEPTLDRDSYFSEEIFQREQEEKLATEERG